MLSIIILSLSGLFSMIVGLFKPNNKVVLSIVILSMFASIGFMFLDWNQNYAVFNNMLVFDNFSIGFSISLISISILVLLLSFNYIESIQSYVTEQISLIIFSLIGMIVVVSYNHLSMLFIGIEIMSIPLYILAGSNKKSLSSNESALKYFLMGAFATGLLLMGITLIYGESSTFFIDQLSYLIEVNKDLGLSPILIAGTILIFAGMAFKVSIFPFHFWTPDVYQGAPSWVTSFMSTAVKTAGFAALFRLFNYSFLPLSGTWFVIFSILAAISITVGTFSAVFQTSLKRILAFSSIAHAGYMLIILLNGENTTGAGLLFYTLAYSIASLVAFATIVAVEGSTGNDSVDSFNGLAKSNPLLALVMTFSMLSLAGIPLTGGFFAKFYVLITGFEAGFQWLVLVAIVNAIVGIYYYFKVIIAMYFKAANTDNLQPLVVSPLSLILLFFCSLITLQLGINPEWLYFLF